MPYGPSTKPSKKKRSTRKLKSATQRSGRPTGVFKTIAQGQGSALPGGALHRQRRQQRAKVRRTETRAVRSGRIAPQMRLPRVPVLKPQDRPKGYDRAVERTIGRAVIRELDRGAAGNRRGIDVARLADRDTRRALSQLGAVRTRRTRREDIALGRLIFNPDGYLGGRAVSDDFLESLGRSAREQHLAGRVRGKEAPKGTGNQKIAGIPLEAAIKEFDRRAFPNSMKNLRVLKTPLHLTRATIEDPGAVAAASARTAVESIAGIPQGVKQLVTDPKGAVKAMGADYSRRYKPLIEGNTAEFRERVKEESGVTPFVLDAAIVAPPVGQGAGAVARTGAAGRAAGRLSASSTPLVRFVGRGAQEVVNTATRERPALRFSAGEGGAVAQRTSRNLFVAAAERGLDAKRAKRFRKEASRRGYRVRDDGRIEVPTGGRIERGPDGHPLRLQGLRPGANEVLPYYSLREQPGIRRFAGRVERDLGAVKSKGRVRLLTTRAREVGRIEKELRKLTPEESVALKAVVQLGLSSDNLPAAVRAVQRRVEQIQIARQIDPDFRIERVLEESNDELRGLQQILSDPEKHITPRVRAVADELRAVQRRTEAADPDLPAERATIRRKTPQGELLGVRRGPDVPFMVQRLGDLGFSGPEAIRLARAMPDERRGIAREIRSQAAKDTRAAERGVATAERRAMVARRIVAERDKRGVPSETPETRAARAELALAKRERRTIGRELARQERRAGRGIGEAVGRETRARNTRALEAEGRSVQLRAMLDAAEKRVKEARATLNEALRAAPRVSDTARRHADEAAAAVRDARTTRDFQRDYFATVRDVTREVGKKETMRLESADEFDRRVAKAAADAGLEEPGYWLSSPRPSTRYSDAAIGTGGRAVAGSRRYTGALHRYGIEEDAPEVFTRGVERNIKRRFSWALVRRNMDVHAFEWSRGPNGNGMTASEIVAYVDRHAIDADTLTFVNARILADRDLDADGLDRGTLVGDDADDAVLRQVHADYRAALRETLDDIRSDDVAGMPRDRYVAVPKIVGQELDRMSKPDGAGWRGVEIVLKQKPARILLGTFNTPWLTFQIASNAFLTGIGGGKNPLDVYGAHKWWRSLTEAERDAIEVELGITRGTHFGLDQTKLGSTVNNRFVNWYRAYKKTRVGRLAHKANPLDFFFKVDEAQNNFFRKVLFYNRAKREAYKRMGANWRSIDGFQAKIMEILGQPPEQMGGSIARSGRVFEEHARHVNEFLGDYITYSAKEREVFARNVMFYGYLRNSLRLVFWTMPVKHPVITGILGNVGRMGAQEIKELFGVPRDYRLRTTIIASAWFGDRDDAKKGTLGEVPFGRMNPGLNAITQMEGAQQLAGLVSPIYQSLADQLFEESSFTGKDFTIDGKPTPHSSQRPANYYGHEATLFIPGSPRNRIVARDLLSLAYPYRIIEKTGIPGAVDPLEGPQSDDALVGSPRPIHYEDEEVKRSIRRSTEREREHRGSALGKLQHVFPLVPRPSPAPAIVEREREREADIANKRLKKSKKKKRGYSWDSGGKSGGGWDDW